jgi:hypothetical protein
MGEDERGEESPATDGAGDATPTARPRQAPQADRFGWRGWVLVAVLVVSLVVLPAAILLLPAAQGVIAGFGFSLRDAYLVLPLPAAILLGAVAVWSALASRREH